jgi:hypothetical protein
VVNCVLRRTLEEMSIKTTRHVSVELFSRDDLRFVRKDEKVDVPSAPYRRANVWHGAPSLERLTPYVILGLDPGIQKAGDRFLDSSFRWNDKCRLLQRGYERNTVLRT